MLCSLKGDQLLSMAVDSARGMMYLSERKPPIVHRYDPSSVRVAWHTSPRAWLRRSWPRLRLTTRRRNSSPRIAAGDRALGASVHWWRCTRGCCVRRWRPRWCREAMVDLLCVFLPRRLRACDNRRRLPLEIRPRHRATNGGTACKHSWGRFRLFDIWCHVPGSGSGRFSFIALAWCTVSSTQRIGTIKSRHLILTVAPERVVARCRICNRWRVQGFALTRPHGRVNWYRRTPLRFLSQLFVKLTKRRALSGIQAPARLHDLVD